MKWSSMRIQSTRSTIFRQILPVLVATAFILHSLSSTSLESTSTIPNPWGTETMFPLRCASVHWRTDFFRYNEEICYWFRHNFHAISYFGSLSSFSPHNFNACRSFGSFLFTILILVVLLALEVELLLITLVPVVLLSVEVEFLLITFHTRGYIKVGI